MNIPTRGCYGMHLRLFKLRLNCKSHKTMQMCKKKSISPALFDWSIIGWTILRRALMNLKQKHIVKEGLSEVVKFARSLMYIDTGNDWVFCRPIARVSNTFALSSITHNTTLWYIYKKSSSSNSATQNEKFLNTICSYIINHQLGIKG